jgi:hypothetical protein
MYTQLPHRWLLGDNVPVTTRRRRFFDHLWRIAIPV